MSFSEVKSQKSLRLEPAPLANASSHEAQSPTEASENQAAREHAHGTPRGVSLLKTIVVEVAVHVPGSSNEPDSQLYSRQVALLRGSAGSALPMQPYFADVFVPAGSFTVPGRSGQACASPQLLL